MPGKRREKCYLAVWLMGEKRDWSDATLISARPWSTSRGRQPEYETMRAELERLFPGRSIHSPLEKAPPGSNFVAVYSSESPDGYGRVGRQSGLYQWAVGPKPTEPRP